MPFPSSKVDEFMRQADLSKLLKDYKPSKFSRETKGKQTKKKEFPRLRPKDILCGRGNIINKHPGNTLMRYAIMQNQVKYFELTKGMKKSAADALIGFFETWDIRFVEADNPDKPNDAFGQTRYRVCSYERVKEKVMQLLRQKIFKNNKHVNPIERSQKAFEDETFLSEAKSKVGHTRPAKKPAKEKVAPRRVTRNRKAPKPTVRKESKQSAATKVTPESRKGRKPNRQQATSSEDTDETPRCVTISPIQVKGELLAAPVLCLATFLRNKLEQK